MDREPDVEIAAKVRARELRFEVVPDVQVRAYADQPATAERISERESLPDAVEPGGTYRDISVRWRLAARFSDDAGAPEPPPGHPAPPPTRGPSSSR